MENTLLSPVCPGHLNTQLLPNWVSPCTMKCVPSTWPGAWGCDVYLSDVQTLILQDRTTQGDKGGRLRSEPTKGSKTLGSRLRTRPPTPLKTFLRKCLRGRGHKNVRKKKKRLRFILRSLPSVDALIHSPGKVAG